MVFHFPFNGLAGPVENTVDNATYALNSPAALTQENALFSFAADFPSGKAAIGIPNTDWSGVGADDFTLECWAYIPSGAFPQFGRFFQQADGDVVQAGLTWSRDDTTQANASVSASSDGSTFNMFSRVITNGILLDEWAHYAVSRVSDRWYYTVNGVILDEWTASGTVFFDPVRTTVIGGNLALGLDRSLGGLMDEFRLTVGQARYGFGGKSIAEKVWGETTNDPPYAVWDAATVDDVDLWDGPLVAYKNTSAGTAAWVYGDLAFDIDQPFAVEFEILEEGNNPFNGRMAVGISTRTDTAVPDFSEGIFLRSNGQRYDFGSVVLNTTWEYTAGDIITIISDGTGCWIGKNGLWFSGAGSEVPDPVLGVNPTVSDLTQAGSTFRPVFWCDSFAAQPATRMNAGQETFYFVPETFASGMQAPPDSQDPDLFYDNILVLLDFDESDGSTTFTDYGPREVDATADGSAVTDDQNQLFGNNLHLTTDSDGARIAASTDFNFTDRPFTVECAFYIEADSPQDAFSARNAQLVGCFGNDSNGNLEGWALTIRGDGTTTGTGLSFQHFEPGVSLDANRYRYAGTINKNQWYRVAYTKEADGTEHMFLDGVELLTAAQEPNGSGYAPVLQIGDMTIGKSKVVGSPWPLRGRIDEVRVTRDHARYTTDYTIDGFPFIQTPQEDPFIDNVVSLHHYDEAQGAFTTFTDEQGGVWNDQGSTTVLGPAQFGVGAAANSGRGILQFTGPKSTFNFLHEGLEDWTFEMSITPTNTGSDQMIVDTGGVATNVVGIGIFRRNTGVFGFAIGNGSGAYVVQLEAGAMPADGSTYQIAVTHKVGVGYAIYIDGVEVAAGAGNGLEATGDSQYDMIIGAWGGAGSLVYRGAWDEVRITRGVARYA